jgi:hypothetical protein
MPPSSGLKMEAVCSPQNVGKIYSSHDVTTQKTTMDIFISVRPQISYYIPLLPMELIRDMT